MLMLVIGGMDGTGHIPLVGGATLAGLVAWRGGSSWTRISDGMIGGIASGLPAVLVLMVVGMLVGVWIAAGVVPVMIHYGLMVLSPDWFLVASVLLSAIVALATGSSWSTAATVGLALMGVGGALNIDPGMTAGAVVSGAYFGDKLSPLSDTTNLAPAAAGAELFEHIRHMLYSTVPALIIALIGFAILGLTMDTPASADASQLDLISGGLAGGFVLSPVLLLPPLVVLGMVSRKVPALPALMAGTLVAAVLGMAVQGAPAQVLVEAAYGGFSSETGVEAVDTLLSRGGLSGMMDSIALILCALAFAGVMESTGMLDVLAAAVLARAKSVGALVSATALSSLGLNVLASDQYIAIIVPGRMYRTAYLERGLHPKNLSRVLEDAGTMTSPLIPWNTCGAYMASVLGVATSAYLPFAFVNLLSPLITTVYGFTRITIETLEPEEAQQRLKAFGTR
jgi:NhaC family Na+:H+ antiporter